jgi:hypothetical protein
MLIHYKNILCYADDSFITTACSTSNEKKGISQTLGIDLSNAKVLESMDSHGGFHGDGDTYVKMAFADDEREFFVKELEKNTAWSKLPLTDNLNIVVYGEKNGFESLGPYVVNDNGEATFPFVENGYYFFLDRNSESKDVKDDTNLLNRNSFNFTIAIYDIDNHTLHYYELDT